MRRRFCRNCGGAFCGLDDIVKRRCGKRIIGFDNEVPADGETMTPEEAAAYIRNALAERNGPVILEK